MAAPRFLPAPRWARNYQRGNVRPDLVAGLTVAVLLIPQSMAYAALAGMPPEAGLYSSIVALLVYAALGTSNFISVAPVAIDSLLVAAAVGPIADGDVGIYVGVAGLLAVMSGLIQISLGALRLGALVNLLSAPVITGFTAAAAVTIAASQLKDLLGITTDGPTTNFLDTARATGSALDTIHAKTVLISVASLVFLVLARHLAPRFPAALMAVAASTAVVAMLHLDRSGVRTLGEVPGGLPTPSLPPLNGTLLGQLAPAAVTIAVISYLESISTAKAFAAKRRQRVDPDAELVAVGAANVTAGLFSGFAVAGGFSRGAVNVRAGARTQLSGVFAAVTVLLALAFLTPLFSQLPKAVLAAIIIVAVATLVDLTAARRITRVRPADGLALLVTFVATLGLGVAIGLGVGVAFSLVVFLARTARPHLVEVGRVEGTSRYRNVERWPAHTDPRTAILRLDGPLYFADASFVEDKVHDLVRTRPELRHLFLVASAISQVDATGAELLIDLDRDLRESGIELHLITVRGPVRDTLDRSGLWTRLTESGRVHATIEDAVRAVAADNDSPLLPGEQDRGPSPEHLV